MLEFELKDMSCGHCVGVIQKTVRDLDPAAKLEVDLAAHRVKIETDVTPAEVAQALTEAGYPPS